MTSDVMTAKPNNFNSVTKLISKTKSYYNEWQTKDGQRIIIYKERQIFRKQQDRELLITNITEHLKRAGIKAMPALASFKHRNFTCIRKVYHAYKIDEEYIPLNEAISRILTTKKSNKEIMKLLYPLAQFIKKMHQNDFVHGKLNSHNIFVKINDKSLSEDSFMITELSYGVIGTPSLENKSRDLINLGLPSKYLEIFWYMYNNHIELADDFKIYIHKQFKKSVKSKFKLFPSSKNRQVKDKERNLWLWDELTSQPMIMHQKLIKRKLRYKSHVLNLLRTNIISMPIIRKRLYKTKRPFTNKVLLKGKTGIALNHARNYWKIEEKLWYQLLKPSILIRICAHEGNISWQNSLELINNYHAKGAQIMVALLQSRQSIQELKQGKSMGSWGSMLRFILPEIHSKVIAIEVGHAINRVKWGIWHIDEYKMLLNTLTSWLIKYPSLPLTGPATIDFDYHQANQAMQNIPKNIKLAAMSVHLYVDRRGAPENHQDGYSLLDKTALLKSIAENYNSCSNKLIISETNWPILNTGTWSPVGACYHDPEWKKRNPGFTETEYASYMIRYIAICLCSGYVEKIYWWRLSAHGYGLISDHPDSLWQKRIAFYAYQYWMSRVNNSEFICRLPSDKNIYILKFINNKTTWVLAWAINETRIPYLEGANLYNNILGQIIKKPTLLFEPIYITLNN